MYFIVSIPEKKPPVIRIIKHPRAQVVPEGGRFRLICKAVSTEDEPLHYQWYRSGIKLGGETQMELVRCVGIVCGNVLASEGNANLK